MKARFRSLLLERINLRLPDLRIRALAVHRHLPEVAGVGVHAHSWSQALLYLRGDGWQVLGRQRVRIGAGSLVLIPPGVAHSFVRAGGRVPLCLAIDFQYRPPVPRRAQLANLNRSELDQVRQSLAQLAHGHGDPDSVLPCTGSALVLQVMLVLLRAAGWVERETIPGGVRPRAALVQLLARVEPATPLAEVIARSGYQRDHLNALVKRETGLTLGQFRAQRRLALAKRLLAGRVRVAGVAAAVGLPDQNYFARWFRRQTGVRPSTWHHATA